MNEFDNVNNYEIKKFAKMLEETNLIILIYILIGICIFNLVYILIYNIQQIFCIYKAPQINYNNKHDTELIA